MRAAFKKGQDRIINSIATEYMLKFLPGTKARHTLKRPMQMDFLKTTTATDAFYEYTREVIPKLEESIELRLLKKFVETIPSASEKKEVIDSYYQRKYELGKLDDIHKAKKTEIEDEQTKADKAKPVVFEYVTEKYSPEKVKEMKELIYSAEGKGLSYHTYDTIGKYTLFPDSHWKRMFPRDSCGNFDNIDFKERPQFKGLMCTEEGLKLTNNLAYGSLPSQRNIDYEKLITETDDLKDVIKDEANFICIYQDFCIDLIDRINAYEDYSAKKVFESPAIFDGVVGILIRELRKKPIRKFLLYQPTRYKILDHFINTLVELFEGENIHLRELKDVIELKRILEVNLVKEDLGEFAEFCELRGDSRKYKIYLQSHQKYCYHFWRPESMREFFLQNFRGFNTG